MRFTRLLSLLFLVPIVLASCSCSRTMQPVASARAADASPTAVPPSSTRSARPSPGSAPAARPAPWGRPAPLSSSAAVAVLRSASTLRVLSWNAAWENREAASVLGDLGVPARMVTEADLERGMPSGVRLLVVPDARCVSRKAAAAVASWVSSGGHLLATGMASYRDENNQRVGTRNNFQWADLFGVDFQRWLSGAPRCEYLVLEKQLAGEVSALLGDGKSHASIQMGRNMAMLVAPRTSTRVLGTWLDADGKTPTTDAGGSGCALVEASGGRVVYAGENLLAPELTRSPEVRALLLALLRRLEPGAAPERLPQATRQALRPMSVPDGPSVALPADGERIRVAIHAGVESAAASATSGLVLEPARVLWQAPGANACAARAAETVRIRAVSPVLGTPYLALYDAQGVLKARLESPLRLRAVDGRQPVQCLDVRGNGTCRVRTFRGTLELTLRGDRVAITNELGVDAYTAGVVPNEVPGSYPLEALKAMAVIARTFSLHRRGFHASEGYDVCATVHCQVYGGAMTEWESSDRAVMETSGEVIRYGSGLADSTFHAVCGGVGEDVEKVWPQAASPYLVAHVDGPEKPGDLSTEEAFRRFIDHPPDAYCSASPRFRWTESYPRAQLQALFEKSLPVTLGPAWRGLGRLRALRVLSRTAHGRVLVLEIEGSDGTYRVEKDRIRWLWSGGQIGQGGLQSTLFYVDASPDAADPVFTFHGGGWGHGVGMCQDGARGMVLRKMDHRAIIGHYYPGTTVEVATSGSTPGVRPPRAGGSGAPGEAPRH